MRIGIVVSGRERSFEEAVSRIVEAEEAGFASVWRPNAFGLDALTVLAMAGARTSRIELGVAVVPTYPRHPHALAQQAASVNLATGGRLALGIGRSHQVVVETMFGLKYEKAIPHMREYLMVLRSLLDNGHCSVDGQQYKVTANLDIPGSLPFPIMMGALMPKMLELCGQMCDGTLTWMCGPAYVADTVVPTVRAAAERAGRSMPRVIVSLPMCVTDDRDQGREVAAKAFKQYGYLPVYRACLDAEGVEGPADIALIGNEEEVAQGLHRIADAGATDFYADIFPLGPDKAASRKRSQEFLAGVSASASKN